MKKFKRGLAAVLATLLMVPAQPVSAVQVPLPIEKENADNGSPSTAGRTEGGSSHRESGSYEKPERGTSSTAGREEGGSTSGKEDAVERKGSPSLAEREEKRGVCFNTGNYEFNIVSMEEFMDEGIGDDYFDDDGSYTIQIPEANPFFPYEVQFTYNGKVTEEWFMTPEDCVEIGGHAFYVSAYFDNTAVTQMSFQVAGDTVVVYPKEKEFTNDGGMMPMSLLPLEEVNLTVDLTAYTPVELTQVSLDTIFTGENALTSEDKVSWCMTYGNDDYTISSPGDFIDLSYDTEYGRAVWEMIVGEESQLAADNIRYRVDLDTARSKEWLTPSVYLQDDKENRTSVEVLDKSAYNDNGYSDYYSNRGGSQRSFAIPVSNQAVEDETQAYVGLTVNESIFSGKSGSIRAYEGYFETAQEAASGTDITEKLFASDMSKTNAGYVMMLDEDSWVTFVSEDSAGNVTGCLPVRIYINLEDNHVNLDGLFSWEEGERVHVTDGWSRRRMDGYYQVTVTIDPLYSAADDYYAVFEYYQKGRKQNSAVTAAYVGWHSSIAEASKAGAVDIKNQLFADVDTGSEVGFKGNYSDGVRFTMFVGADGSENQEIYKFLLKSVEGVKNLSDSTAVYFNGLRDANGDSIDCYVVDDKEDSYGNYNYLTIMVDETVDLTSLAPEFYIMDKMNLYASGSSTPEISGKSVHDFSNGPVQYTASAENKEASKNYWLQIVKAEDGEGKLYVNSLADQEADTKEENGVIYSTREIFIDGLHNYVHDIVLANMGKTPISDLNVELASDSVELDDYWTLNGGYELSGFAGVNGGSNYGELPNLAKIRLKARTNPATSSNAVPNEASGTLTIKSGSTVLMVFTLTGAVGDPSIITTDIPQAVKYVPYGTMIQNSNKYDWNQVSYRLVGGKLPAGMEVKPNGEIYGVPTEAGTFTFTVQMQSSIHSFASSRVTYDLVVVENTDANVDGATDSGYDVLQRIPDITLSSVDAHTFVSKGVYGEFVDVFIDGQKLAAGTDYDSESGSTRITIKSQTLKVSNTPGTHTLGVEFRTKDTNTLKRAAQNYRVEGKGSISDDDDDEHDDRESKSDLTDVKQNDPKKGVVDPVRGIITGNEAGYSHWLQDEYGWKLIYADGTAACGYMAQKPDGTSVEQVLWEKVNGSWYAFGTNQYLKSGWVYDYQLGTWYCISVDSGMRTGWYQDPQDGCTYYLELETGKFALGWKQIDEKWYYFNETTPIPTWKFDEAAGAWVYDVNSKYRPYGSLYRNGKTPDGYYVGEDGAWNGAAR
ncbi:MAG: putative Ig domain-containing protein [Lachnospiraceae bacterium]|nr:putative Ig domain-containing protein [Lachnospiraceae bacterium]